MGLLVVLAIIVLGCSGGVDSNFAQKKAVLENTLDVNHENLIIKDSEPVGLGQGELSPDFSVQLESGSSVSVRDFKGEKPVLLYFFATWCPHCANDFRELSKVYPDYKDDVKIIAQSLDLKESQDKIDSYKQRYAPGVNGIEFLAGKESVLRNYQIRYTTTKYALGKDGKIMYSGSGELNAEQWRTLLDAMKAT